MKNSSNPKIIVMVSAVIFLIVGSIVATVLFMNNFDVVKKTSSAPQEESAQVQVPVDDKDFKESLKAKLSDEPDDSTRKAHLVYSYAMMEEIVAITSLLDGYSLHLELYSPLSDLWFKDSKKYLTGIKQNIADIRALECPNPFSKSHKQFLDKGVSRLMSGVMYAPTTSNQAINAGSSFSFVKFSDGLVDYLDAKDIFLKELAYFTEIKE